MPRCLRNEAETNGLGALKLIHPSWPPLVYTYSLLPQNHSWLLGKTLLPFSVTIPTAGGVVVEVKEGVVVGVSSNEWTYWSRIVIKFLLVTLIGQKISVIKRKNLNY